MTRNILIGLGAGLAAALLFASVISGTMLALPLFLLSPLPVAIAGIGFGTLSGATAAGLAAAIIAVAFNPLAGLLHLLVFGAPVAWAAHLVGLSRQGDAPAGPQVANAAEAGSPGMAPVAAGSAGTLEWFPLGMVLARLAIATAAGVVAAGAILGYDPATLVSQTVTAFEAWLAAGGAGADAPTTEQLTPVVSLSVAMMPATAGCFVLGAGVLNLWLGGHIARMSGLLRRGWTPLWSVQLPRFLAPVLGVAIVGCFLPGGAGHIAAALAGASAFAFALAGYGALHALLRGKPGRFAMLFLLYAASIIFMLPILIMAAVGLADTLLDLRFRRMTGGSGRPS